MNQGMTHLYWGEGKGKTTAAMGLAMRARGSGMPVLVVQFLKDGASSELEPLRTLGAQVLSGKSGTKFVFQMTEEEKAEVRALQTEHLRQAAEWVQQHPNGLLVLDEALSAWQKEMLDRDLLRRLVEEKPEELEVVMTGRDPADWMHEAADYSTEMRCHKHPYKKGVPARRGIEF